MQGVNSGGLELGRSMVGEDGPYELEAVLGNKSGSHAE